MTVAGIIVGKSFITAMVNGKTETITEQHPNYARIREAVKVKDYDAVERLTNISQTVSNFVNGKVRVDAGRVLYGETEIQGAVVDRILDMIREGFDAKPMMKFLENLMSNPSKRAVDELYLWLEQTRMPITEDGCFLAYKKVQDNYRDFYTGSMDNSVGKILEMPRNAVDDNRDRTCSEGLHFCSLSYLPQYHGGQGRVMIVKINPADVVSIPSDYSNAKGRTCRYEVIGEHTSETTEFYDRPVYTNYDDDDVNADDDFSDVVDDGLDDNPIPISGHVRQEGYDRGYEARLNSQPYDDHQVFYSSDKTVVEDLKTIFKAGYNAGWTEAGNELVRRAAANRVQMSGYTPAQTTPRDNSGLVGYNRGRSDAAAGRPYNANTARDGHSYCDAYAKGWDNYKQGK